MKQMPAIVARITYQKSSKNIIKNQYQNHLTKCNKAIMLNVQWKETVR